MVLGERVEIGEELVEEGIGMGKEGVGATHLPPDQFLLVYYVGWW